MEPITVPSVVPGADEGIAHVLTAGSAGHAGKVEAGVKVVLRAAALIDRAPAPVHINLYRAFQWARRRTRAIRRGIDGQIGAQQTARIGPRDIDQRFSRVDGLVVQCARGTPELLRVWPIVRDTRHVVDLIPEVGG